MAGSVTISALAGLAVGIMLVFVFSSIFVSGSLNSSEEVLCWYSIEEVKENASFEILLPETLPDGYSLQSVDFVPPDTVYMQYFTRPVCDPDNPASHEEGYIEIVESPLSRVGSARTGEEYVQRAMASFAENGLEAKSYVFQNGRMPAAGYDRGLSESIAIDENGEIVHRSIIEHPATIWVVDDKTGTIVKIQARSTEIPLEQLAAIAESLKEYTSR